MKKIFMMAVMAAAATTAFAQSAAEQAAEWNAKSAAQYKIYMDGQQTMIENQLKKVDTPADVKESMYTGLVEAFKAAYKCNEFDIQPNEKGKVKPKFQKKNAANYKTARKGLIDAGMFFFNEKKDKGKAFEAWSLYVDSPSAPLFANEKWEEDKGMSEITYFASRAAYDNKDYENAVRYANIAIKDTATAADAQEIIIFSQKECCKTKADSVAYLNNLKELRVKYPKNERFLGLIYDYYSKPWLQNEKLAWLDEETAKNPQDKMPWAYKGETLFYSAKYSEAAEALKKAVELDPNFTVVCDLLGRALYSKAAELKDKLANPSTGRLTPENEEKVKAAFMESKDVFEKIRSLDPNQETSNWAYCLYQVYYQLGDEAKASEMEKLKK